MTTAREATIRLAELLRSEHHALADFLVALAGFDRGRGWVELGHRSLFAFLTRELGLSKGAAYYRMSAAGLIQRYPEVLAALRDGTLCLSSVVELAKVLTPENRAEVLPRFLHVSKREAKEVTAELLPVAAPPLRTVVTSVQRSRDRGEDASGEAPAGGGLASITGSAVHPANLVRASSPVPGVASVPSVASAPSRVGRAEGEPLTAALTRLHLTVARRLLHKLAAARDALSHSHPTASDAEIIELGLDLIVERHRKRRGIGAKARRASGATRTLAAADGLPTAAAPMIPTATPMTLRQAPMPKRSRHVPAHVWRAVWARDGGWCVWPLENGDVCGSTRRLQLDHVDGWALGAETSVDRCRLLCAAHNLQHARTLYGDAIVDRYAGPKGSRCSDRTASWGGRVAAG